ncbi:calcium/sodium antiporter [Algiphilus sp.]|uniref:calcium/sodium antiporter n=1 Tax=Algiphilus sp. TaxID=1872431 RepID=UPI003BA9C2D6
MLWAWLAMAAGLGLLYVGAEGLVRGSASLAGRLGLTPLVIGLTVVAFGTSMPELAVSVEAALNDRSAIALGNVVGSNIGNIGLILALAAMVTPLAVQAKVLRVDTPLVIAVSVLLLILVNDGHLGRIEGTALVAGVLAYVAFSLWSARRESAVVHAEFAEGVPAPSGSVGRDILFVVVGLTVLVVGARMLVQGAITVAEAAGLSDAIIGLTIVAIGTSLPELAASVVAAAKGEGDIAVGNVLGSNLFNILGILGITSLIQPLESGGVGPTDLWVMVGFAVLLAPLMRTGWRIGRWEGVMLLLLYVSYLAIVISGKG